MVRLNAAPQEVAQPHVPQRWRRSSLLSAGAHSKLLRCLSPACAALSEKFSAAREEPAGGRPGVFHGSRAHSTTRFTPLAFALPGLKCDLLHRSESAAGLDSTCRSRMSEALIENGMCGALRGGGGGGGGRAGPEREQRGPSSKSLGDSVKETESHPLGNAVVFDLHQPQVGGRRGGGEAGGPTCTCRLIRGRPWTACRGHQCNRLCSVHLEQEA